MTIQQRGERKSWKLEEFEILGFGHGPLLPAGRLPDPPEGLRGQGDCAACGTGRSVEAVSWAHFGVILSTNSCGLAFALTSSWLRVISDAIYNLYQ